MGYDKYVVTNITSREFLTPIVETLLLDAFALPSSGLYNGRSGVALALGTVASAWNDNYIYEQYVKLLKTSLVALDRDLSFSNGVTGNGWALMLEIADDLVDANYLELMGRQHEKIVQHCSNVSIGSFQEYLLGLGHCYYLSIASLVVDDGLLQLCDRLYKQLGSYLISLLEQWSLYSPLSRPEGINAGRLRLALDKYVRLCFYRNKRVEYNIERILERFYSNGSLAFSPSLVCYLHDCIDGLEFKSMLSKRIGIISEELNASPWYSLSECIDILVCLRQSSISMRLPLISRLETYIGGGSSREGLEARLHTLTPIAAIRSGYHQGLARYLLYALGIENPRILTLYFA